VVEFWKEKRLKDVPTLSLGVIARGLVGDLTCICGPMGGALASESVTNLHPSIPHPQDREVGHTIDRRIRYGYGFT